MNTENNNNNNNNSSDNSSRDSNRDSNSQKRRVIINIRDIINNINNNNETTPKKHNTKNDESKSPPTKNDSSSISISSNNIITNKPINYNDISKAGLYKMLEELQLSVRKKIDREELIDRIRWAATRKEKFLNQKEYLGNLNSFSKGHIELEIKDGLDPCEGAFWKVFRNVIMFKSIMSNMDKELSIDYEAIVSVTGMIKHNKLSILRDKVLRNQYLVFDKMARRQLNYNDDDNRLKSDCILKIFTSFRNDNDQDYLFYKSLFKYYQQFIFHFNHFKDHSSKENPLVYNVEQSREILVNGIIEAKCLVSFRVLVEEYSYTPTESNFQHAVKMGATKFLFPIISNLKKLEKTTTIATTTAAIDSQSSTISRETTTTATTTTATTITAPFKYNNQFIEMLLKCKNNNAISFNSLWYLIKNNFINVESNDTDPIHNIRNLLSRYTDEIEFDEADSFKSLVAGSNVKSLILKKEINSNFNKELNHLHLNHPSFQQVGKKEMVNSLLTNYYGDEQQLWPLSIQYCFGDHREIDYKQFQIYSPTIPIVTSFLKASFQFADVDLFRIYIQLIREISNEVDVYLALTEEIISTIMDGDFMFSHCSQFEKRKSFLYFIASKTGIIGDDDEEMEEEDEEMEEENEEMDQFISPLSQQQKQQNQKENEINVLKSILKPELLYILLVGCDDLQLIGYFEELLGEKELDYKSINELPFSIFNFIKSNETLEHVFMHHGRFLDCIDTKIWDFKNAQLLQCYINLLKSANGENIQIYVSGCEITSNSIPMDVITFMVEAGRGTFRFEDLNILNFAVDNNCKSDKHSFHLFKSIFINYVYNGAGSTNYIGHNNQPFYTKETSRLNSHSFIKLLDWVYLNHCSYLNTINRNGYLPTRNLGRIFQIGIPKSILLKIGKYTGVNLFETFIGKNDLCFGYENLKFLDYFLSNLKNEKDKNIQKKLLPWQKDTLYKVLRDYALSGRLRSFEYIFYNQNWVFKQICNSTDDPNDQEFQAQQLIELLSISLSFNHIHLARFFLETLPAITKQTFNQMASDLSKIHFSGFRFKKPQNNKNKKRKSRNQIN